MLNTKSFVFVWMFLFFIMVMNIINCLKFFKNKDIKKSIIKDELVEKLKRYD